MHESSRNNFNAILPAQKLLQYEEFKIYKPNPFIAAYARYVSYLLRDREEIDPPVFIETAETAIDDLRVGIDSTTDQPISGLLVGKSEKMYYFLSSSIPYLAKVAFPEDFAKKVKEEYDQRPKEKPPVLSAKNPEDEDVIPVEIKNTDQAMEFIILGAKQRILGMDWESVGLEDREDLKDSCDSLIFKILETANMGFPLDVIDTETQEGQCLFYNLPDDHKTNISKNYWLVIKDYSISPQTATSIRDWVWINAIILIAESQHINGEETLDYFKETNESFQHASQFVLFRMEQAKKS